MAAGRFYRATALLCLAGILAFCVWLTIAPGGFPGLPIGLAIIVGLLGLLLYVRPQGREPLWAVVDAPAQTRRVLAVILMCVAVQFSAAAALQHLHIPIDWVISTAVTLAAWIGLPIVAFVTGNVRWPRRTRTAPGVDLVIVGGIALLVASAYCYLSFAPLREAVPHRLPGGLPADAAVTLVAATTEEVVFRVLLLTVLLAASGSRLQALVLSSTLFAVVHVPLELAGPILANDWNAMPDLFLAMAPSLFMKLGVGFLLGALWLRTGSLVLIGVVHALGNFGPVLGAGFVVLAG